MHNFKNDILQILPNEDLPELKNIFSKKKWPYGSYVYNFLSVCIDWKKKSDVNYFTVLVPMPMNWKEDGTFVCLMEFGCYDIFIFTFEENCKTLCNALINTKRIDWTREVLVFAVHDDHATWIQKLLKNINFDLKLSFQSQAWRISVLDALNYEIGCPGELYIGPLNKSHIPTINEVWPHKYPGSEDYLLTMLNMNYGYGLFLKVNEELIGWVMKNHIGIIGILQVKDNQSRKGYGTLLAKIMAKQLAEEGLEPFGFIVKTNARSNAMFKKLGFKVLNGLNFYKNTDI